MIVQHGTCYTLHTAHTSYQLAAGPGGMLLHTYYGPRLQGLPLGRRQAAGGFWHRERLPPPAQGGWYLARRIAAGAEESPSLPRGDRLWAALLS